MAREDTRWFIAAVVLLSVVLFFALPMSMLFVIDHMRLQSQLKAEIREVQKLRKSLSTERKHDERANPNVDQPATKPTE
jgi:hypothetical protein